MMKRLTTIMVLALVAGCAGTPADVQKIDALQSIGDDPRILLMPPDVRYYRLTAGGVPEPNEEWTSAAQANFSKEAKGYATQIGADLVEADRDSLSDDEIVYETLHSAVGNALLTHHYGMFQLPAKAGRFDWSLGPGVAPLRSQYDADYALFVHYRDYQASGGRVAFALLAAAAGVGVPMGAEFGFASLVDLGSGDIVWFNRVVAGSGELRKEDEARKAVVKLLGTMPRSKAEASGATE